MRSSTLQLGAGLLLLCLTAPSWAIGEGTVFGKVTDEAGRPVAEVTITLEAAIGAPVKLTTRTSETGEYRIVLPNFSRAYRFRLEREGFRTLVETVEFGLLRSGSDQNSRQNFVLEHLPEGFESSSGTADDYADELTYHPANARYNKALEKLQDNQLSEARRRFEETNEAYPKFAPAFTGLAMTCLKQKDFPSALAAAEQALALAPQDHRALQAHYEALAGLGDERAPQALDDLLTLDPAPEFAALVHNEGVRLLSKQEFGPARERFQQALHLDPNLLDASRGLTEASFHGGDYAAAIAAAETLMRRQKQATAEDLPTLQLRYKAYEALGDRRQAKAALKDYEAARKALQDAKKQETGDDAWDSYYDPG